ncbi:hypothetical protein [Spirosoma endophyticum]|uniref:Uncharacterized protein n=1 Tax=Spirosoma endophyticum TaxID=662367 RepID=A0A1I2HL69_9BACT|nr:hypothetical protein [Spirosoma endophyticum]SFF29526.1 hypothetical protein SAMN05216167_1446 [Spirosoma endophyticum]
MDLLRLIINKQKNAGYTPKKPVIEPMAKGKIPRFKASISVENILHRNEQIAQRREKQTQQVPEFDLRMDVLWDDVQRVKENTRWIEALS